MIFPAIAMLVYLELMVVFTDSTNCKSPSFSTRGIKLFISKHGTLANLSVGMNRQFFKV